MNFKSLSDLKSYIIKKEKVAMQLAQERIYHFIDQFVKEYYAEYSPSLYERTYQLYKSLVKSKITETANGCTAEVYFDASLLDYYIKTIEGRKVHNKNYSAEKTLEAAAHGYHGSYDIGGTAIWDEPIEILNREAFNILKKALIDAGIPVK